jgi:hypothetical protein
MSREEDQLADSNAFNRRFKYSLIAYAVIEFIVMVLALYYKATR